MGKCVWGPMYLVIDGEVYGTMTGFNYIEGGVITTTTATMSGGKTRSGEYMLHKFTGGSFDGCQPLPTERCGLTVTLVMIGNRTSDDPDVLKSITLIDADINGAANQAVGGNGAISDLEIVACNARHNYGRAAA